MCLARHLALPGRRHPMHAGCEDDCRGLGQGAQSLWGSGFARVSDPMDWALLLGSLWAGQVLGQPLGTHAPGPGFLLGGTPPWLRVSMGA